MLITEDERAAIRVWRASLREARRGIVAVPPAHVRALVYVAARKIKQAAAAAEWDHRSGVH